MEAKCNCLYLIDDTHAPNCPTMVEKDLKMYMKGMMSNNNYVCVAIEKKYGLYGATPEMVTTELRNFINAQQGVQSDESHAAPSADSSK